MKSTTGDRDARGRLLPGHSVGANTRWRNTSGNPAGSVRARREFENSFYEALISEGGAAEAVKLLWTAAREKQPWAIQTLLQRLAPQTQSLHLVHERGDDYGIDYGRLTDEQIQQLESILESAGIEPAGLEAGEGEAPALTVHPTDEG